jgi:hypothetical protein
LVDNWEEGAAPRVRDRITRRRGRFQPARGAEGEAIMIRTELVAQLANERPCGGFRSNFEKMPNPVS